MQLSLKANDTLSLMSELFTTATALTILGDRKAKETDFLCGIFEVTELCCGWYYSSGLIVAVLLCFLKEESDAGSEVMDTSACLLSESWVGLL